MKKIICSIRLYHLVGILFLCALGSVLIMSCGEVRPENSRHAQAQRGKVHFMKYCSSCHGEDGKGVQVDTLSVMPADLTRINRRRRTDKFPILAIANIVDGRKYVKAHGTRPMPVWGEVFSTQEELTEDQIKGKLAEILAYLMSIQGT